MAINFTNGTMAWPWQIDKGSFDRARGFHDGIALLKMIADPGDAPEGSIPDLLNSSNPRRLD